MISLHTLRARWLAGIAATALISGVALLAFAFHLQQSPPGMRHIPAGQFLMGSQDKAAWPEEGPVHMVHISHDYWMDEAEVSNAQFARFADATGYRTVAERVPRLEDIMAQLPAGAPPPSPGLLQPGSLVFTMPSGPVDLADVAQWWQWTPGASWRHPEGPGSNIANRSAHPAVHLAWEDAAAYCHWAGKRLPSEAEWERAARGGVDGLPFVWGDQEPSEQSGDSLFANIWQGKFPTINTQLDGYVTTAPVKQYRANPYGLYDMAGNVWEWVQDWYDPAAYAGAQGQVSLDPSGPVGPLTPAKRKVQRGGSFLCNADTCSRYRPSARQGAAADSGTSHAGVRCAKSVM